MGVRKSLKSGEEKDCSTTAPRINHSISNNSLPLATGEKADLNSRSERCQVEDDGSDDEKGGGDRNGEGSKGKG